MVQRDVQPLHRPDQTDTALYFAIVEHEAATMQLDRSAFRTGVDQQLRTGLAQQIERFGERQGLIAVTPGNGEEARLCTGCRMGVDRLAASDGKAVGNQRFRPEIVTARGNRALDLGAEQLLEGAEEHVLHRDGQGQQPVEEGGDRRQLVPETAAGIGQRQAGHRLEGGKRALLDLACIDQPIKLTQRVAGIGAFEIVLGTEQALTAGLPLPTRDRAKRVEPPGDG